MTILVTGASGFVGSAIVRHLLAAGYQVRVLLRAESPPDNLAGLDIQQVIGDLTDAASLKAAVKGCSSLIHTAADYRLWAPDFDVIYAANVQGTKHIMHAALDAGIERIVYTSSVATLGVCANGIYANKTLADENTPSSLGEMIGHYKRSKFMAEAVVRKMAAEDGLPVVIVNPSMPAGPRDIKPTPSGQMILDSARGHMPAYVNTGLNIVHVDDVAKGHLLALEHGKIGERYILGGENLTLKDILSRISILTEKKPPRICLPHNFVLPLAWIAEKLAQITSTPPRMTVDGVRMAKKHMYYSSAKAEKELGYTHRPAIEALHDAVDWFQNHGYCP